MDQSDFAAAATPPSQDRADMDDPRQHFAWALGSFPGPNPTIGDVPLHPMVRPELSQRLWDFGFRWQEELQTKWVIPGPHPEAGYLNVPQIVDRAAYEQYRAAHAEPDTEKWQAAAQVLLAAADPNLAARIQTMNPEEKAAALEEQRHKLPAAFARLAQLKAAVDADTDQPPEQS